MKSYKQISKFNKAKWDGMSSSFRAFKKAVEGHLLQVGAGYLTDPSFVQVYLQLGHDYLKSDIFQKKHQVSYPQAIFDREHLYGILMSATIDIQNKIIIKYESTQDGILAWHDLKKEYAYDGSMELRIEQLEATIQKP